MFNDKLMSIESMVEPQLQLFSTKPGNREISQYKYLETDYFFVKK